MKTFRIDYVFDSGLPEGRHFTVVADGYTIADSDHLFHLGGRPVVRIATKLVKTITEETAKAMPAAIEPINP